MKRLRVFLPPNRVQPGWAHLIGSTGAVIESWPILGKADNAKAAAKGNPTRDPLRPFGDTPTGDYAPVKVVEFTDAELAKGTSVGRRWFHLRGTGGDAAIACGPVVGAFNAGARTGLGLHAGRPGERLVPTYGCLRMLENDLEDLCAAVGDDALQVSVEEV